MTASATETILANLLVKDEKSCGVYIFNYKTCSCVRNICYIWSLTAM